MIAVDSSALIAVVAGEKQAAGCETVLLSGPLVMSAATLTESLIVAARKGVSEELRALLALLELEIEDVTPEFAELAAASYIRWGKGFHTAHLNYGDCFSYAVAQLYDCPLLYIGDDFAQTDVTGALDRGS
ncbi:MAG: type II toxin-antitoxin system VapC family toxin [Brevundimonas sp.]|uniref:type II toxin-antitoxin system VapC family toxin n=1 Tax=Brevundimonas sp. TaxID=1871086 RepID=UPI00391E02EA